MNRALLRAKMVEHGDTLASLAKALGIGAATLRRSMYAAKRRPFTEFEIATISMRYKLTPDELFDMFFSPETTTPRVVESQ